MKKIVIFSIIIVGLSMIGIGIGWTIKHPKQISGIENADWAIVSFTIDPTAERYKFEEDDVKKIISLIKPKTWRKGKLTLELSAIEHINFYCDNTRYIVGILDIDNNEVMFNVDSVTNGKWNSGNYYYKTKDVGYAELMDSLKELCGIQNTVQKDNPSLSNIAEENIEKVDCNKVNEKNNNSNPISEESKQNLLEYTYFSDVEEKVTADDVVNLRDIPSQDADSTVLRQLKNGEIALRTGVSDTGWSRLVLDGETYYAFTSYLTTNLEYRTPTETGESGLKTEFTVVSQKVTPKIEVNLRSLPSATNSESTVIATVKAGEVFERTGINQEYGWSRVEYQGQTLYCISSYIEIIR